MSEKTVPGAEIEQAAGDNEPQKQEPSANVGCLLCLAFLLILPPFIFFGAPVVLLFLVAAFVAWLGQLLLGNLSPSLKNWKVWLVLWLIFSGFLIFFLVYYAKLGGLEEQYDKY